MDASDLWPGRPKRGHAINTAHLSGRRRWQVEELGRLAGLALARVSETDEYGDPVPMEDGSEMGSPRRFVATMLGEWIAGGDFANAPDNDLVRNGGNGVVPDPGFFEAADPRGVRVHPIPGDVLWFHDGHVAICVEPQCYGCLSCEVVEFASSKALDAGVPPCIRRTLVWLAGVREIWRPVPEKASGAKKRKKEPASPTAELTPDEQDSLVDEDNDRHPEL